MAAATLGDSDPPQSTPAAAITTPFWDAFLTGGLSVVGMGAVLFLVGVAGQPLSINPGDWIALSILINTPHFMASYRVLYASRARWTAHRWATLIVPAILIGVLATCALAKQPQPILGWLVLINSVYLAWHYAGQAWGMTASFSHLAGIRFSERERFCLRAGPRALLTLHVLFALTGRFPPSAWIDPATYVWGFTLFFKCVLGAIVVTLGLGVWAFYQARARHGQLPIRAVLPWIALYFWYPFWYFVPGGFLFVQLAHALQYLAFPIRIEVNRYAARAERTPQQKQLRAFVTYGGLVLVGAIVLHGPPLATVAFGEGFYSTPDVRMMLLALTQCVGIHHYFVDGAIWRLRNRDVRVDLFSHLTASGGKSLSSRTESREVAAGAAI